MGTIVITIVTAMFVAMREWRWEEVVDAEPAKSWLNLGKIDAVINFMVEEKLKGEIISGKVVKTH